METQKKCTCCEKVKPITAFYIFPKCIDCQKEHSKNYKKLSPERRKEINKQFRQRNKCRLEKNKKEYYKKHPERRKAINAVAKAIISGKLTKQNCEICEKELCWADSVQAHHKDYNKSLDVIWLCPKHHSERHKLDNVI